MAFTPEGHEPCSRFGAILYGASARYGRVAVKVVPWFSPRLKTEVFCYRHLPYREMCPLYDVDEKLGAMLLRYVPAANSADHAPRERVFRSLYEQRRRPRRTKPRFRAMRTCFQTCFPTPAPP